MLTCAEPKTGTLKDALRDVFVMNRGSRRLAVRKHQDIYTCGNAERTIYLVESGSIRIATQSAAGKECLLRIGTAGEVFGEIALLDSGGRPETATARETGAVWVMHAEEFIRELRRRSLCEEFMLHLIRRVKDEERHITYLVTEPSRRRLGRMLLLLAGRIGTRSSAGLRINLWISHEEWAGLVGMTRPRVSTFLSDFSRLNLIRVTAERHLIIHEAPLRRYLEEA